MMRSEKTTWLIPLILLFILGGMLRLLDITDPPLDFHPSRQLRNSLVARDLFYSWLPSATAQQRDLADSFAGSVGRYEPPVVESIVAITYLAIGHESVVVARIWETAFWLIAGAALFDLMRRAISPQAGLLGLAFYLVLPFSVQASRSFQPDPLMTSAFVTGIYFLYLWSMEQTWKHTLLAGAFLGLAVFVKIIIAFFAGAAAVALVLFTLKKDFWKSKQVWVMALIMVVPALVFYVLLNQGRSTEYFFSWTVALMKLITSTDFYTKWLAFLGQLFGLTVIFLAIAGTFLASPRLRWLLIGLWIGYLLYGLTLPFQMYTHSYYHIQLIPIVALGLAAALDPLLERASALSGAWRAAFVALLIGVIGFQSWVSRSVLVSEDFHHEPKVWEQIGQAVPADAKVVALTQDYGFRLMMYGWRKVAIWPYVTELAEVRSGNVDFADRFEELTVGKDYFLVTAFGQLDKQPSLKKLLEAFPVASEGDGYILYGLR